MPQASAPLPPMPWHPWFSLPGTANDSRRLRLWELEGRACCPVVKACVPLTLLRRVAEKALGKLGCSDCELDCTVVTEGNSNLLDATLAAADLLICQSGCISHNAYWRAKNHCKRNGGPCVFTDTPSRAVLARARRTRCERELSGPGNLIPRPARAPAECQNVRRRWSGWPWPGS